MIEDLQFFKDRVALAGPDGYQINHVRAEDRTVSVVKKWTATSSALRANRAETMTCLEARPGKGDNVTLAVVDKERFTALQAAIIADSAQLAELVDAIKRLDEMGPDLWFRDLGDQVGSYGRTEFSENQRLANLASSILARKMNTGKPADQILAADEEYQHFSKVAKEQIENANKQLWILRPKLEAMKQILESVGC